MKKREKEKRRNARWAKRICLTEKNYNFLKSEMKKNNYKTLSGTLDKLINEIKWNTQS